MAEVKDVVVPDIGDFSDVPIIEVLVAPGQEVNQDDPLVTLESDKATMEIPAPFAGVVQELKVSVGDTVSEGAVVLTMAPKAEAGAPAEAAAPAAVASAVQAEASAAPETETETQPPSPPPPPPAAAAAAPQADAGNGSVPYASPSVRRRARELGVDLSTIQGSGRKGRITLDDLERRPEPATRAPAAPSEGDERVALTRIQRISAENLSRAWQTVPHVTHNDEADITDLEAFRKQLNAEQSDVKVTMVALLLKATASTIDAFPRFASTLDGEELVIKRARHLGFAADTPNGLIVPVIRDVDRKGLLELAGELTELSGKARAGKLSPKELSGAVFTISSLGGIGGTSFSPIVNPPQVAILGVVRSVMRPVWDGSQFAPRLMLPLSLSYDHRVIDGAAAARFVAHLGRTLTDLRRVLL